MRNSSGGTRPTPIDGLVRRDEARTRLGTSIRTTDFIPSDFQLRQIQTYLHIQTRKKRLFRNSWRNVGRVSLSAVESSGKETRPTVTQIFSTFNNRCEAKPKP